MYNPDDKGEFPDGSWDFRYSKAPHHLTYTADTLSAFLQNNSPVFTQIDFQFCDFFGNFNERVVFKNCRFEKCDFGMTEWIDAKFTRCEFRGTSFTQATFRNCEFRDCIWADMGLSGNETRLPGTLVTNPGAFIEAAYTNQNETVLAARNKTVSEQRAKLEGTKATVARHLLAVCSSVGDEQTYYDAVKTYVTQSTKAKQADLHYALRSAKGLTRKFPIAVKIALCFLDEIIAKVAGTINAWGASIARPFMLGFFMCLIFGTIYWGVGIRPTFVSALMASADITLLVGYTKHAAQNDHLGVQVLFLANMLGGIFWYAVFIATIVNRVSRVR